MRSTRVSFMRNACFPLLVICSDSSLRFIPLMYVDRILSYIPFPRWHFHSFVSIHIVRLSQKNMLEFY